LDGYIVRNKEEIHQALEEIQAQDIQRYLRRPENDETPQQEQVRLRLEEQLYPFLNMVMHYQRGRRTCVTYNFYLGTVPAEAEEGDVIAIFFGIGVPFVLRPLGRSEFRLIGHCYVHGVMDGELVELENNPRDIKVRSAENVNIALV